MFDVLTLRMLQADFMDCKSDVHCKVILSHIVTVVEFLLKISNDFCKVHFQTVKQFSTDLRKPV